MFLVSSCNCLCPKSRMTIWLEQCQQAVLQLHPSDQPIYRLLRCDLYYRFDSSYTISMSPSVIITWVVYDTQCSLRHPKVHLNEWFITLHLGMHICMSEIRVMIGLDIRLFGCTKSNQNLDQCLRLEKRPPFWQATFSNAFCWLKMIEFKFKFHWNLSPRVQVTLNQLWLSEWVIKFNGLSWTADIEVHVVHISHVIIVYTLE